MIHPLLLAYARAKRAEHLAAVEHAPTGVASPAMVTHRAYAAWAAAGFPVEAEAAPVEESRPDLVCPGCGGGVAWGESSGRPGAWGGAQCLADEIAAYKIRGRNPVAGCGWTGRVVRREDGEVEILTGIKDIE